MTTFLVWNIQRKPLGGLILPLVRQHKVDVLALIEQAKPDETFFKLLQKTGNFQRVPCHQRFGVYTRFDSHRLEPMTPPVRSGRVDFWHWSWKSRAGVVLV